VIRRSPAPGDKHRLLVGRCPSGRKQFAAQIVRQGHVAAVGALLEAGADPNAKALGGTPLALALERGRAEVIGALARRDRRRNSSTRSSSSNAATPVSVVPASHRRLRMLLASISTKTSSAGCSRHTIGPRQEPMDRPG